MVCQKFTDFMFTYHILWGVLISLIITIGIKSVVYLCINKENKRVRLNDIFKIPQNAEFCK